MLQGGPERPGQHLLAGPQRGQHAGCRLRAAVRGVPARAGGASPLQDAGAAAREAARLGTQTD